MEGPLSTVPMEGPLSTVPRATKRPAVAACSPSWLAPLLLANFKDEFPSAGLRGIHSQGGGRTLKWDIHTVGPPSGLKFTVGPLSGLILKVGPLSGFSLYFNIFAGHAQTRKSCFFRGECFYGKIENL